MGRKKKEDAAAMSEFDIMEKYNSGDKAAMDQAVNDMCKKLDKYIGVVMNEFFDTYIDKYGEDLYNSGIVGILSKISIYDPSKSKPTYFFKPYIVESMRKFINSECGQATQYYIDKMRDIRKVIDKFSEEGIVPTVSQIADATGFPINTVTKAMEIMNSTNHVHPDSMKLSQDADPISSPWDAFSNSIDPEFGNSDNVISPEDSFYKNEKIRIIDEQFANLNQEERFVIYYRMCVDTDKRLSYKEISDKLGTDIARVRQIQTMAKKKLKASAALRDLVGFEDTEEDVKNNATAAILKIEAYKDWMDDLEEVDPNDFDEEGLADAQ